MKMQKFVLFVKKNLKISIWNVKNYRKVRDHCHYTEEYRGISNKDPYESKYYFLINKRESTGLKHLNDSKAFIEYSNDMDGVYKNIEEYNPNKKRKILIVFDDMIADMLSNKKLNPILTELFIRGRKLNISLVFLTESYFTVPQNY